MTTTSNAAYPLETFGPYTAIPNGDGGYQLGAGNLAEANMQVVTVTSATGDITLTAAQALGGIISCNKGSDAALTVTSPTGAQLDAGLPSAKIGSTFELTVTNNNNTGASSTVTFAAGASGVTLVGTGAIARYDAATYRFVRTAAATWLAYRK